MMWFGVVAAVAMIVVVLIDAFEVVLLPRRVRHGYRLARLFYRTSWMIGRTAARLLPAGRCARLPEYLRALVPVRPGDGVGRGTHRRLRPAALVARHRDVGGRRGLRHLPVLQRHHVLHARLRRHGGHRRGGPGAERGRGRHGFRLPGRHRQLPAGALSGLFGREITISLLDARAGSPPSAGELLRRLADGRSPAGIGPFLVEWERWAAELLESHLSFPVLSYYRSQHENQSWVGALTAILDTSALLIAGVDGPDGYQARLTFAMARHAAVDLALVFQTPPLPPQPDRLPEADLARLRESLRGAGVKMRDGPAVATALEELRGLYEPFVNALAALLPLRAAALPAGKAAGGQLADQSLDAALARPRRPAGGRRRGRPLRLISVLLSASSAFSPSVIERENAVVNNGWEGESLETAVPVANSKMARAGRGRGELTTRGGSMEGLIVLVLWAVVIYFIYRLGKRIGSRKGYGVGRRRGRFGRRR